MKESVDCKISPLGEAQNRPALLGDIKGDIGKEDASGCGWKLQQTSGKWMQIAGKHRNTAGIDMGTCYLSRFRGQRGTHSTD